MLAILRYVLAIGLFMVVGISCDPSQTGERTKPVYSLDLEAIVRRGYIRALVDNNSISYFIYRGKAMGYEYELLQLLAKRLNVKLKITVTTGVDQAIQKLQAGEGDILAFPLTVNKPRKEQIAFTQPHFNTFQVLVQRKPAHWRKLTQEKIDAALLRTPTALSGRTVHVLQGTSHAMRMRNLSEEIGMDIDVREDTLMTESEGLIRQVSAGEIDYAVADHVMAQVNAAYYPNLDVRTVLSMPQQIAWGVRKNSPLLLNAIDDWLRQIKKAPTFMVIYNRYFKSPRTSMSRMRSDYFSYAGNRLSPYDYLIKQGAERLGWDWRLLAALVYQESKFNPQGESWAGARGLMQLMPETARRFGADDVNDPQQSIQAGVSYLRYLDRYWTKSVPDSAERLKFVLASYNAGLTHILDAKKLTEKYSENTGDSAEWDEHVQAYLLKKSDPKFYRDPLVQAGYCKCEEPVNYIKDILTRYEEYRMHIRTNVIDLQAVQNSVTAR